MPKKYLTINDVADRYSKHRNTIERWIKTPPDDQFPRPIMIGAQWHFALDELEAYERQKQDQ